MSNNSFSFAGTDFGVPTYNLTVLDCQAPYLPPLRTHRMDLADGDGSIIQGSSFQALTFTLRCAVIGDTKDDLKEKLQDIADKLAVSADGLKPFSIDLRNTESTTRTWQAKLTSEMDPIIQGFSAQFSLTFEAPDPIPVES